MGFGPALALAAGLTAGMWSSAGPPGAPSDVFFGGTDARRAYATTKGGLFLSESGGRTWAFAALPRGVTNLVAAPSDPRRLYALSDGFVVRSSDRGLTWTAVSPLPLPSVYDLAVDPGDPETVLAYGIVDSLLFLGGTARSADGGRTWEKSLDDLPYRPSGELVSGSPESGAVLAVYSAGGFPFVQSTFDGGRTWTLHRIPFTSITLLRSPAAADSERGSVAFYAAVEEGVIRTADAGATWSLAGPLPATEPRGLAVRGNAWFVLSDEGVFRSDDFGATWARVLAEPAFSIALSPSDESTVLVSAGIGVWRSADGGRTFALVEARLPNAAVSRLFVDASDRIFALPPATVGGPVFLRTAAGWTHFSTASQSVFFELDPGDPSTQYRVAFNGATGCPPLERSADSGRTWVPLGLRTCFARAIGIDLFDSSHLIVTDEEGILVSHDQGSTFEVRQWMPAAPVGPVAFDPRRPGRVYVGPWTSGDGGQSWTSGADPCTNLPFGCAGSIAIDPRTGVVYEEYFAMRNRLAKSEDFGATWTELPAASAFPFLDVAVDPASGELYLGTSYGVLRSSDGGAHFDFLDGLHAEVSSVRVRRDGTVFAAAGLVWEFPGTHRPQPLPPSRPPRTPPRALSPRARIAP